MPLLMFDYPSWMHSCICRSPTRMLLEDNQANSNQGSGPTADLNDDCNNSSKFSVEGVASTLVHSNSMLSFEHARASQLSSIDVRQPQLLLVIRNAARTCYQTNGKTRRAAMPGMPDHGPWACSHAPMHEQCSQSKHAPSMQPCMLVLPQPCYPMMRSSIADTSVPFLPCAGSHQRRLPRHHFMVGVPCAWEQLCHHNVHLMRWSSDCSACCICHDKVMVTICVVTYTCS